MDRVLVTGCGGFVGRILCPMLRGEGCEVWGTDRTDAGSFEGHEYRVTDLADRSRADALLDECRPRFLVHLAAQSSGGKSFDEPHMTIYNNALPVLHILEFLRSERVGTRLLAVGSADVYGVVDAGDLPLRETRAPRPNNPYALSKTIQEQCAQLYSSLYGLDVVMTRSFNHTGWGRPDRFVLSSFARQVVEISRGMRDPVVDVGNIDVRRDFSDVRDVCRAYAALLTKGRSGEIYNVCSGTSHSLRELLERLTKLAGVRVEVRVDRSRLRPSDMEELRGDNDKMMKDTGWSPAVPIDETLRWLLDFWIDFCDENKARDRA